jgi:hypothetical protein
MRHVAHTLTLRMHLKFWMEDLKGRDYLGYQVISGREILKKWGVEVIGLIWTS